ncbi:MAG: methylisocitrate lyase, partial [Arenicella sp.]
MTDPSLNKAALNGVASPGQKLRLAVEQNNPLQVVGTVNAYSAIMAEKCGHKAIYL